MCLRPIVGLFGWGAIMGLLLFAYDVRTGGGGLIYCELVRESHWILT
jgi:hypothetical protein